MRKLQLSAALSAALEDNELFPVVTDETTSEVEETLIELDESYDEARDAVEVVEELEDRGEQVEELVEAVESYIAQGGMSPEGATLYYMQLNRLGKGLEALHHGDMNVSTEDYSSRDRMSASLEAAEKGKNFAAKIWDAIVAMAKAAYDAIGNFFGRLLNSNASLKKQAKALGAKAGALRGELKASKETSFASGTWARNLTGDTGGLSPKAAESVVSKMADALVKVRQATATEGSGGIFNPTDKFIDSVKSAGGMLPGSYSTETTEGGFVITRKDVSNPDEVEPLSSSQVRGLASAVEKLLTAMDGFGGEVKGTVKKLTADVEKAAKAGDSTKEQAANARKRISLVRKAALEYPRIGSDVARSALIYCNKSLKAIGPQSEKDGQTALKDQLKAKRTNVTDFTKKA